MRGAPGWLGAMAAVLVAGALAGCVASDAPVSFGDDGDTVDTNLYESADVTAIGVTVENRTLYANVSLTAGLYCPETASQRFRVYVAFHDGAGVVDEGVGDVVVPREGTAATRVAAGAHVDPGELRRLEVRVVENATRETPPCDAIATPDADDPTVYHVFTADVTERGVGDVEMRLQDPGDTAL